MKDLFGNEIEEHTARGGGDSVYKIIGASNHCREDRADKDFYATDPKAVELLCGMETFCHKILEPSCGQGHISKVLLAKGYEVESRDLVDRGFGKSGCDFLAANNVAWDGDIVMNPPYELAAAFVGKALDIIGSGRKVAAFLKLTFAEGIGRRTLFEKFPPSRIWVSSSRLECGKNGVFGAGSAVCYCWWIWEKGFCGDTVLKWFN